MAAVLPLLSTERGAQATQLIQGIVLLVSGVHHPISVRPGWLRWLGGLSYATTPWMPSARRSCTVRAGPWSGPTCYAFWPRAWRWFLPGSSPSSGESASPFAPAA